MGAKPAFISPRIPQAPRFLCILCRRTVGSQRISGNFKTRSRSILRIDLFPIIVGGRIFSSLACPQWVFHSELLFSLQEFESAAAS